MIIRWEWRILDKLLAPCPLWRNLPNGPVFVLRRCLCVPSLIEALILFSLISLWWLILIIQCRQFIIPPHTVGPLLLGMWLRVCICVSCVWMCVRACVWNSAPWWRPCNPRHVCLFVCWSASPYEQYTCQCVFCFTNRKVRLCDTDKYPSHLEFTLMSQSRVISLIFVSFSTCKSLISNPGGVI